MKVLICCCLCSLCIVPVRAARGGEAGERISPELAEAAVRAIAMPAVRVATTTVPAAAEGAKAAAKAHSELFAQMRERSPERKAPDQALVRVCMKLLMRINTGWLKSPMGIKVYPSPEDMERFAEAGGSELEKFSGSLPENHEWTRLDGNRVQGILIREIKKGINTLPPYGLKGIPPVPEPDPEEMRYFGASR